MHFLLALILSIPIHASQPVVKPVFVQKAPVVQKPSSLTLYKPTGEKVAFCSCTYDGTTPTLTKCEIKKGYTLDDVMNAWLDAYANKSKLEAASE
jgi:transcription elongation factor Elf1